MINMSYKIKYYYFKYFIPEDIFLYCIKYKK